MYCVNKLRKAQNEKAKKWGEQKGKRGRSAETKPGSLQKFTEQRVQKLQPITG